MREVVWLIIVVLALYALYQLYLVSKMDKSRSLNDTHDAARSPSASEPAGPAQSEAFKLQLEMQQLRRDVAQLRSDQDERRRHVAELEERVQGLKAQLDHALLASGVAPEYGEALVFARRGMDVDSIAERCGISMAEAELVRSLAGGQDKLQDGEKS